jgi:hypothetical protein
MSSVLPCAREKDVPRTRPVLRAQNASWSPSAGCASLACGYENCVPSGLAATSHVDAGIVAHRTSHGRTSICVIFAGNLSSLRCVCGLAHGAQASFGEQLTPVRPAGRLTCYPHRRREEHLKKRFSQYQYHALSPVRTAGDATHLSFPPMPAYGATPSAVALALALRLLLAA